VFSTTPFSPDRSAVTRGGRLRRSLGRAVKPFIGLLLTLGSVVAGSCRSTADVGVGSNIDTGKEMLAGLAALARNFGNRVPANKDLVRLMMLPTDEEGNYHVWQLAILVIRRRLRPLMLR
jgi:hypothetical protein